MASKQYYNDKERIAVTLARMARELSDLRQLMYTLPDVDPSVSLYPEMVDSIDSVVFAIPELADHMMDVALVLDREAGFKALQELATVA